MGKQKFKVGDWVLIVKEGDELSTHDNVGKIGVVSLILTRDEFDCCVDIKNQEEFCYYFKELKLVKGKLPKLFYS